jgi:hypothetical protein
MTKSPNMIDYKHYKKYKAKYKLIKQNITGGSSDHVETINENHRFKIGDYVTVTNNGIRTGAKCQQDED